MADKDFKVKNKLFVNGLTNNSGVVLATNNNIDSATVLPTQFGGTGTTTSPNAGQILYSSSGATYAPATFSSLPGVYSRGNTASRPASPAVGDLYYNTELNYFEVYTANGWFPIAAAPLAPTGVTATNTPSGRSFNDGRMTVAFSSNTSGGAPTSFIVTPSPTTSPSTFTGSTSPIAVTGLASSTQYTYTVQATSPYGTSSASSASSGVTATTVPQAPTINSVTGGNAQADVAFTAGATGGAAISSYTVTSSPGSITASGSSSPITVTGLTNGTAYTFTVTATNANGTSAASSASSSVTPTSLVIEGGYDALATITVPSGGLASLTFSSIPTEYKHLQIRAIARSTDANQNVQGDFYVNGINSGAQYAFHHIETSGGGTVSSTGFADSNTSYWQRLPGNTATANVYGVYIFDLLDYASTTKFKTFRQIGGFDANGSGQIFMVSNLFKSLSPITSMTFSSNTGNLAANTQFALYGMK